MAAQVDGRTQVDGRHGRRRVSRAPDLGWPTKPWYSDVERVVGVAVVAFLLLAVLLALVVNGGSSPAGAPSPVVTDDAGLPGAEPSAPATSTATDTQWYADTTTLRDQLADSGGLVRRHVEASDGVALEPECARLGTLVSDGQTTHAPADVASAELWSDAVSAYAEAAAACGQLFDGTQIEVAVLLDQTTAALDEAEQASTELGELFTAS